MIIAIAFVGLMASSFVESPIEEKMVKVQASVGDTIWDIAREHYTEKEVRCFDEFVWQIRKDNNLLGNNVLQAGQTITIVIKKQK